MFGKLMSSIIMTSSFAMMYMIPKSMYEAFLSKANEGHVRFVRQINNLDVNDGGKVTIRNDNNVRKSSQYTSKPSIDRSEDQDLCVDSHNVLTSSPVVASEMTPDISPNQNSSEDEINNHSNAIVQDQSVSPISSPAQDAGVQANLLESQSSVNQLDESTQTTPIGFQEFNPSTPPNQISPSFSSLSSSRLKTMSPEARKSIIKNNQTFKANRERNVMQHRPLNFMHHDDDDDVDDEDTIMDGSRISEFNIRDLPSSRVQWLGGKSVNNWKDLFSHETIRRAKPPGVMKLPSLNQRRQARRLQTSSNPLALEFQPAISRGTRVTVPESMKEMIDLIAHKGPKTSKKSLDSWRGSATHRRKKLGIRMNQSVSKNKNHDSDQWITLGKRKSDRIQLNEGVEPPVKYIMYDDENE